jgi:predicted phosphate transport protein (TIGR00153 family)
MVRLIPRDEKFFGLFEQDGDLILEAARKLDELVANYDRLEERIAEIHAIEKKGDAIDEEVILRLERSFTTPFEREDMHELVNHLDDVLDGIYGVAETFQIYGIQAPTDEARQMVGIISAQAAQLRAALGKLESGKDVTPHLRTVQELESKADQLSRSAIGRLFKGDIDALEVIRLRELYNELEETIDAAEDAADVIERILATS